MQCSFAIAKKGFNASILSLFDFENSEQRDAILTDGPIYEIVDREKIAAAMKMKKFPNSYAKFLFNFVNARIFLDHFS